MSRRRSRCIRPNLGGMSAPMTLALALLAALPSGGSAAPPDCGLRSLCLLLRLEGADARVADLQAALPEPSPQGYSLLELREAAAACGIDLAGVRLVDGPEAIRRAALVHLRQERADHFVVVRPLADGSGRFQVIDPDRPPAVLSAAKLRQSPEWTGFALIRGRSIRPRHVVAGLAAILAPIGASCWVGLRVGGVSAR